MLIVLSIVALLFIQLKINNINILIPDLVFVVTAHMVYFCAFTRSEIFQKCQGIRDGSRAISFSSQWVNMNGGSCHTRSFRRIHLLVLGTALQVGFEKL